MMTILSREYNAYSRGVMSLYLVFTARCYACAVLAMGLCLSVSVCHKSEFY